MTVTAQTPFSGPYENDGVTTQFAWTFKVYDADDLLVTHQSEDMLVNTVLIYGVDFDVDVVGADAGGMVTTFGAYTDGRITITRATPVEQGLNLENQGAFFSQDIMRALDKIVMMMQDFVFNSVTRALTLRPGDPDPGGAYDAGGNRITNGIAGTTNSDFVIKSQLDAAVVAAGNVPTPGAGNVGKWLKATGASAWAWTTIVLADISDMSANGRTLVTQTFANMKVSLGLNNVDNTADASKPVSTAQAAAILAGDSKTLIAQNTVDFPNVASNAATTPADNTIPQIGEGFEYMSITWTPTSASSILEITGIAIVANSGGTTIAVALHRDAVANALKTFPVTPSAANFMCAVPFRHVMAAGGTSLITFRIRIGGNSGTTTFNGTAGAQLFGGVSGSHITVKEFRP